MKFPAMTECTGCGECCGPVYATEPEVRRIRRYVRDHGIEWHDRVNPLTCGFLREDNRCAIYEARPTACRMFGVIAEMQCSYFPEAVRMNYSADKAVAAGLFHPGEDKLLAEHFAPDEGAAMLAAMRPVKRVMEEMIELIDLSEGMRRHGSA